MNFFNKPNKCYKVTEEGKEILIWNSRSVAVNCVIALVDEQIGPCILVSKRGPNAADFQGKMNIVAGYLDWDESGTDAVYRETWEECGVNVLQLLTDFKIIRNDLFDPWSVKTFTDENRQNVSLRYGVIMSKKPSQTFPTLSTEHNEIEGEVESPFWMPYHDIDNYEWAFKHDVVIKNYLH